MKHFLLGCNYWASNAGTAMWKKFDPNAIEEDLRPLSGQGVSCLRVFPIWSDFQPVIPLLTAGSGIVEYRLEGDIPSSNSYYLNETMMSRFSTFCDLCDRHGIRLIVGLLTGWMSGRLFIPPALFGKNLISDHTALLFEQKFIMGFVSAFRQRETIYAWDIGNECACMSGVSDPTIAENWTCITANAIRATDSHRPIISGVHNPAPDPGAVWSIRSQAEYNDILICHPYPYWSNIANKDRISSYRTALHATYMGKLFAEIGGKPCLTEEIGTMGPMICNEQKSADFLRCNLFSNWANGSEGVLWWCANDQTNLTTAPYSWNMCELELGLLRCDHQPKPTLTEYRRFSDFLSRLDFELPKAEYDAVCILTQKQNQTAIGFATYCLAKQNDINLKFTYCTEELPFSDVYMLPSVCGHWVMPHEKYEQLRQRIKDGATLYISNDGAILSEFSELTGLRVEDSETANENGTISFAGKQISFRRSRVLQVSPTDDLTTVLANDNTGNPAITIHSYGKGKVCYLNFPLESVLATENISPDSDNHIFYGQLLSEARNNRRIFSQNHWISTTEHHDDKTTFCVAVNYSSQPQKTQFVIKDGTRIAKIFYGSIDTIPPYDALVFSIES